MRARNALAQHRGGRRLNRNHFHVRVLLLQILAHAGDRSARADARHKEIHSAVGILPDFRAGARLMHSRVRRVHKLPRNKAVRNFRRQLVRLGNRALHALRAFAEHQLRAVGLHQLAALDAHRLRHHNDDAVAACRRDGRQADARVAGGRLDDDAARLERALSFRIVNHALRNTILDRTGGIEILQLGQNMCVQVFLLLDVGQLQQRGMADQLVGARINLAHGEILPFMFSFNMVKNFFCKRTPGASTSSALRFAKSNAWAAERFGMAPHHDSVPLIRSISSQH